VSELELLAQVKAAATREVAPPALAARVLANMEYRALLEAPFRAQQRRRWRRLVGGAGAVGVAAAAWLWTHPPQSAPPITAESAQPSAASAATGPHVEAAPVDPCSARVVAAGKAPLIDDFEDGDDALAPLEQRAGFWRWARETDAPGTAPALLPVPRPDPTVRSRLALHVKGGNLQDWGAAVQVSFRPPCYDVSSYGGIALSARGPGRVYVSLREVGVIPRFEGGTCEQDCYNPHVAKLELTGEWRRHELRWADLRQRGIDKPPLDLTRLHSIAFLIRAEDTPYDAWFDDLRFLAAEP
jgi:Complex I intermediate-associated protein 30 (CIA30)